MRLMLRANQDSGACRDYEGGSLHGKTADFPMRDLSLFVVGVHDVTPIFLRLRDGS